MMRRALTSLGGVAALFAGLAAPGHAASVLMNEKAVLEACIRDHADRERCRCYLGTIKGEAGPDLYEQTVAYVAATFTGKAEAVEEVRREYDLTPEREQAMAERLQAAAKKARRVCDLGGAPSEGQSRDRGGR